MDNLIVEQQREYYPMTFYTDSLNQILNLSSNYQAEKIIFKLEPILVSIERVYFYSKLKLNQVYFGYSLTILFLLSCFIAILFDLSKFIETVLFLVNIIVFVGYVSLEHYRNKIKKDLTVINNKISSRNYEIITMQRQFNSTQASLLINTLDQRDKIYDFTINNSANKGLSEAYFLNFLTLWFSYPWRILEHCQFEDNQGYTPTADFILINDDFKLAIDLEIDEPYTLKELLPIHLVEDKKYIYRDKFFLSLGYIVIRFAEYQIAKYPDYCCLYIARVLNQFLDDNEKIRIPNLTEISPLNPQDWKVKSWTQRESQIMAENKIRDIYLEPVKAFNRAKSQ